MLTRPATLAVNKAAPPGTFQALAAGETRYWKKCWRHARPTSSIGTLKQRGLERPHRRRRGGPADGDRIE